jgi:hypothetical protein
MSEATSILLFVLFVVVLIGCIYVGLFLLDNILWGQTPPAAGPPVPKPTTPVPAAGPPAPTPAPVVPTVTNTPTPTASSPNFQYLPQKAYVQSYGPEVGVPANTAPLQAAPIVVAPPVQQPAAQAGGGFDIGTIISMAIAAGSGLFAKMGFDKAKKAQGTVQEVAENNVKQATVQQKTLEQVYEIMPDKGVSIKDKPEIKLENVAKVKDEALKVASKA